MNGNFGEINGKKVRITDHAIGRMVEMGITPEEFSALITEPEEVYSSKKYVGVTNHRVGKYSLALREEADGTFVAITLLYGTMEDWCEAARDGKLTTRALKAFEGGLPRRRNRD